MVTLQDIGTSLNANAGLAALLCRGVYFGKKMADERRKFK